MGRLRPLGGEAIYIYIYSVVKITTCYSIGNSSKTKKKLKSQIDRVVEGCTNVIMQHKQL
jgi:hypothetical protein